MSAPSQPLDAGAANPFDLTRSWLGGRLGLADGSLRPVGVVLVVVTVVAFAVAGLGTLGWLVPTGLWAPALVVAVAASSVLLGVFFSPRLVLGLVINAALLLLVVTHAWRPG